MVKTMVPVDFPINQSIELKFQDMAPTSLTLFLGILRGLCWIFCSIAFFCSRAVLSWLPGWPGCGWLSEKGVYRLYCINNLLSYYMVLNCTSLYYFVFSIVLYCIYIKSRVLSPEGLLLDLFILGFHKGGVNIRGKGL